MGCALPMAIGVKMVRPDERVWSISGDGGFQMNIQELGTIMEYDIDIKILLMNNGYLGMVRQWQELFYDKRYVATPLSGPDFVKIAEAYGIAGVRVNNKIDIVPAIEKAMAEDGPFLVDFRVEPEENVYPMVPPGEGINAMVEEPRETVKVDSQKIKTRNM